jgi:hypothetical protein
VYIECIDSLVNGNAQCHAWPMACRRHRKSSSSSRFCCSCGCCRVGCRPAGAAPLGRSARRSILLSDSCLQGFALSGSLAAISAPPTCFAFDSAAVARVMLADTHSDHRNYELAAWLRSFIPSRHPRFLQFLEQPRPAASERWRLSRLSVGKGNARGCPAVSERERVLPVGRWMIEMNNCNDIV